jgi:GNAT superfamily N-acetyltransferase
LPPPPPPPAWEPLTPADLGALMAIAGLAHPALPERVDVFAEKLRLFPAGCRKLMRAGRLSGYAISHPWRCAAPPQLDTVLGVLPADADCLFIHDIALAPEARGDGAAAVFLGHALAVAAAAGLPAITLVAAYGTARLWRRYGFVALTDPALGRKLACYGEQAVYMRRPLP